jgi:hypothetical protein
MNEEYGFGKGIPTENAAFRLTACVLKSIKKTMQVAGNFCD